MRRAAGVVVLAMVGAVALPIVLTRPAAAFTLPTLTWSGGTQSGGPGAALSYNYVWNTTDCTVSADNLEIQLFWDSPYELIQSTHVTLNTCLGPVAGTVPSDTTMGDVHTPTASLYDVTAGSTVSNSEAIASSTFSVSPAPTPTPTPTPTPAP